MSTVVKAGLSAGADPLQLLAPRLALSIVLLWLWVAVTRPHRMRISPQGLKDCALAGILNGLALVSFYLALRRIDAGIAVVVFSIFPAILLVLLHLRGEAVNRRDLLRLVLAVTGVALVAEPSGGADPIGVAWALGCAALFSLHMLVVHSRLSFYAAPTTTLWIVTFLGLTVFALAPLADRTASLGVGGWAVVAWSSIVGTVLARLAAIEGIRLVGGGQAALLMPIETILAVTWAALLLGERMSAVQALGAALALLSALLATVLRRPRTALS